MLRCIFGIPIPKFINLKAFGFYFHSGVLNKEISRITFIKINGLITKIVDKMHSMPI